MRGWGGVATFGINYHTYSSTAAAASCVYGDGYIQSIRNFVELGAAREFCASTMKEFGFTLTEQTLQSFERIETKIQCSYTQNL